MQSMVAAGAKSGVEPTFETRKNAADSVALE
jgi:hypothetical protein